MPGPIFPLESRHESNDKSPWWVRAIVTVGVPSVLALGLAWWLTTRVDARLENIQINMHSHQLDTAYIIKRNDEQNIQLRALIILTQQVCVNTSRTEEARNNCWNPYK